MPRIKGHALIGDGRPHTVEGVLIPNASWQRPGISMAGCAKCKCGWIGEVCPTQAERRNDYSWHIQIIREENA